jgi:ABC-type uncharacterized transport system ATPase subunit
MWELKERGTGMLLCTHEFWTVQDFCDDLYILNKGKIVYSSHSDLVNAAERHLFSVTALAGLEQLSAMRLARHLPNWSKACPESKGTALAFAKRDDAKAWLTALVGAGLEVVRFSEVPVTSEEELMPYFKVTGEGA